jgi:pimeloyl-ACP methyl ester carboxylesterase
MHARVSTVPPSGEQAVLVHGLIVSGRYMVPTAERLAPFRRVYVPDLPGFGESPGPARVLDVAGLSDALASWMREMALGRAVLLGNSFGCQIVADFAVRHPELIERAVLQGPTVDPHGRTILRQAGRWLLNSTREPPPLASIVAGDYLKAGFRRAVRTIQYMLEDRIEEKLPRVRVPALVVRGSRDPIVPQRWAEEATALLPRGRLVVVPGVAHTMNYVAPLELARVVRPFLEETHADEEGVT